MHLGFAQLMLLTAAYAAKSSIRERIFRGRIWILHGGGLYSILKRTKEILSGR